MGGGSLSLIKFKFTFRFSEYSPKEIFFISHDVKFIFQVQDKNADKALRGGKMRRKKRKKPLIFFFKNNVGGGCVCCSFMAKIKSSDWAASTARRISSMLWS